MTRSAPFEAFYIPEPMSGCWLWIGGVSYPPGYGRMTRGQYAHRVSYEIHRGKIPVGMHVLHRCDNRLCVNPDHLFLGTQSDNMRDMMAKGRGRPNGKPNYTVRRRLITASERERREAADYHLEEYAEERALGVFEQ